jgi:RHS repeat-associated protein
VSGTLFRAGSWNTPYYIFSDRLGSYRTLTDSSGNVKGESDYYPFGAERVISSTVTDNFRFAGMEWDSEDGLNHTLYRQYTPAQCRWESPDPVHGCVSFPQGQNLYAYVRDDPTNLADADGDQPASSPCVDSNGNVAGGANCLAASWGRAHSPRLCASCLWCCVRFSINFMVGCVEWCAWLFPPSKDSLSFFIFLACVGNCATDTIFDIDYCVYAFFWCLKSPRGAVAACCYKPPFSS